MPAFADNKNVMCYLNDIYVYLRARSHGRRCRAAGPQACRQTAKAIRAAERQMHGPGRMNIRAARACAARPGCLRALVVRRGAEARTAGAARGRARRDRTRRSARVPRLRRSARSAVLQRGRRGFREQDRGAVRPEARQGRRLHLLSERDRLHSQHAERAPLRRRDGDRRRATTSCSRPIPITAPPMSPPTPRTASSTGLDALSDPRLKKASASASSRARRQSTISRRQRIARADQVLSAGRRHPLRFAQRAR